VTKKAPPVTPVTVADEYAFVVGVDTHAATHSYAIIEAPNGGVVAEQTFATSPAGLRRARDWIARRTRGDVSGVLVAAEGTGSYGAVLAETLTGIGYRVVEAPTPRRERGRGKTDAMDAVTAARSTLAMPMTRLRDRRGGQHQVALQVLTTAREQLNAERLRAINAWTALVRCHDLGEGLGEHGPVGAGALRGNQDAVELAICTPRDPVACAAEAGGGGGKRLLVQQGAEAVEDGVAVGRGVGVDPDHEPVGLRDRHRGDRRALVCHTGHCDVSFTSTGWTSCRPSARE
jgi:hypothetical protein